jgi:hypothetical protein
MKATTLGGRELKLFCPAADNSGRSGGGNHRETNDDIEGVHG